MCVEPNVAMSTSGLIVLHRALIRCSEEIVTIQMEHCGVIVMPGPQSEIGTPSFDSRVNKTGTQKQ